MKTIISRPAFTMLAGLVISLLCCQLMLSAQPTTITLIDDGRSDYVIVVPDTSSDVAQNKGISAAAVLLQSTLKKSTRVQLAIVPEGKLKAGTPAIYLGKTIAAQKGNLPLQEISGWTTLKTMRGRDVFLLGNDSKSAIDGSNITYQGTLKAVTSFLQGLGVRYLLPGQQNGTHIPQLDRVAVPANMNVMERPFLSYVTGRVPGDPVYAAANNYLRSDVDKSFGGHSYYTAVPAAEYAETHPEYFILKSGTRTAAGNHLCISNPNVRELMLKQMEKYFDDGYQWVELAQTDGYVPCECDKCRAINIDPGERTWIFHRDLAAEMAKRRPGKKVMIIAYGPTKEPPQTFKHFPDNVIIEMSGYSAGDFAKWSSFGSVPKTVYIYNWGSYQIAGFGPKRTSQYVAEQARLFRQNDVRGIYLCGAFDNWGLQGPVYYVYGKMLENPDLDWKDLANEFYRDAYGKSAAPMADFFDTLYARLQLYCDTNRPNYPVRNVPDLGKTPGELYAALYPRDVLLKMTQDLEAAKKLDADPAVQARLRLVEREFDYVKTLADAYHAYQQYQSKPSWDTFDAVEKAVNVRTTLINSWFDETGKKKAFDGFPAFLGPSANSKGIVLAGGRNRAVLGEPFDWTFAELRKNKFLPGLTQLRVKRVDAGKLQPFAIDGKYDKPGWQKITQGEFVESNMRKLLNGTKFRIGYDDQNLYIAFDCTRNQMQDFNIKSAGRDGGTYRQEYRDELEIFFYLGDGKYYRFFFNPAADSTFDGRYGFITDDVDPRYGKWDNDWDGKWDYAFDIDRANNRWTAEVQIPFSTIGVQSPEPGDTLQVRLRRVNFLYQPKLMGWAPGGPNSPVVSTWTGAGYRDYGVVTFK